MNLNTEIFESLSSNSAQVDESKCAVCHRDLRSPAEWIRAKNYFIA
jgi:hypothetical protein